MKLQHGLFLLAVIGSLVLVNVMGLRFFGRLDVARDGAYTLAAASKETLKALEEPVTITAYFTENLPAPYSSNARYVRDLLEEFRSASHGQVAFEFIDPAGQETDKDKETRREVKQDIFGRRFHEPTSVEKELTSAGVQPVELRVIEDDQQQRRRAYMGLVIKHQEKKEVIPVVKSVDGLEYDLTTLIRKLSRSRTPVIGILQGHDEPSMREKLRFLNSALSQTSEVRPVTLGEKGRFDGSLDALMVIGPKTALSAKEIKAVDQFLMEGKSVALFLDSERVDLQQFNPTEATHGLTPWLSQYGVTLGDQLVADVNSASINVSEQRGFMLVQMPCRTRSCRWSSSSRARAPSARAWLTSSSPGQARSRSLLRKACKPRCSRARRTRAGSRTSPTTSTPAVTGVPNHRSSAASSRARPPPRPRSRHPVSLRCWRRARVKRG